MHGRDDAVVPLYHGMRLRECLPEICAWPAYFPEGACHNDLVDVDPEAYYAKLRAFVKSIQEGQALTPGKEIGCEMVTAEGQRLALRPAQEAMVSLPSGITRQKPTQQSSGSAGCKSSPVSPRDRNLSVGTAAVRRSKSAGLLEEGPAARSRATLTCSPEASPRATMSPRPSRPVKASLGGAGVSKLTSAITEEVVDVDQEAYGAKLRVFVRSILERKAVTADGQSTAQRPSQVAMSSLPSGSITRDHDHKRTRGLTQCVSGVRSVSSRPSRLVKAGRGGAGVSNAASANTMIV